MRTGEQAAAAREVSGKTARPPPADATQRVAVGSRVPWSALTLEEARVRGAAESQVRQENVRRSVRLAAKEAKAKGESRRLSAELKALQRELTTIDKATAATKARAPLVASASFFGRDLV